MSRRSGALPVNRLVDNMFRDVFTNEERAMFLGDVMQWESANPQASPASRVSAWIDLAYEFQSARTPAPVGRFNGPSTRLAVQPLLC